jgi:hypothetical protein
MPVRPALAAGLAIVVVAVSACGGGRGTGLVFGTIDDSVAESMSVGMTIGDTEAHFNGKPMAHFILNGPLYCDAYRGVDISGEGVTATAAAWQFCFHNGTLVLKKHVCLMGAWTRGEINRYENAGYTPRRKDCAGASS